MPEHSQKIRGFTIMELIVVISIVGILAAASAFYIREVISLWRFVSFRDEIVNQARFGLLRLTRDMRQVANNTAVYAAGSARFNFRDYNGNNIDYYLSANNLMRNSDILIKNIDSLNFIYYDNASAVIASPRVSPQETDIYLINITLDVRSGTQAKTLKTQVFPRNFGKKE